MCDFGVSDSVLHSMVLFSINGLSQGAYKNNNIITSTHSNKLLPRNVNEILNFWHHTVWTYMTEWIKVYCAACERRLQIFSWLQMNYVVMVHFNPHLLWTLFFHYKPVLPVLLHLLTLSSFSLPPFFSLYNMTHPTPCCWLAMTSLRKSCSMLMFDK